MKKVIYAEVGCAKNIISDMVVRNDPKVKEDLVILAESQDFPSNSFGLRKEIPFAGKAGIDLQTNNEKNK